MKGTRKFFVANSVHQNVSSQASRVILALLEAGGRPMAILSGKRLALYEILSAIGAGGMGEVYRARDTRLERTDGPAGVVSPDGQRFLAVQAVEPERPPTQINIVLKWFEELKRRAPTGK
jgi:serine/threonine protein kinase